MVFYPKYFYWMDSAFQTLLRHAGQSVRRMRDEFGIVGIPIVEANARFLLSATHEDVLTINAAIQHWGKRSFRVEYNGFCGSRQIFSGFEVRVWLKRANDGSPQAAAIPSSFKDVFDAS